MDRVAIIGFGEAARAFAGAPGWRGAARTFDLKLAGVATRRGIEEAAAAAGVSLAPDTRSAVADAAVVVSVVTADQVLRAAEAAAPHLVPGALFLDLNSVAPDTKRAAAHVVERAGGRYADVAVMAPVHPARLATPLLVGGRHRDAAAEALRALGFTDVSPVEGPVGAASAIKMIRSVMVKGLEALSAECAIAARAAGVLDQVVASLDASWPGADWGRRFDYNLGRMMVHGLRRAAEMEEAAATLAALGVAPTMTRGTIERQHAIGTLHAAPPAGLDAKLAVLAPFTTTPNKAAAA